MADELNKLLISIEADTALLRRALKDADAAVEGHTSKVDSALSKNEGRFKRYNQAADSMFAKLAGAFSIAALTAFGKQALDESAALDNLSKVAGLTTDRFQTLRAVLTQSGVGMDQASEMVLRYSTQMGELRSKSGEFYDFLRKQVPTLYQQIAATKDQGAAWDALIDGVSRMTRAEDRAIVLKKALGDQAVVLANQIGQGVDAFHAQEMAIGKTVVVSRDAIEANAALEKEASLLWSSLKGKAAEFIGSVAPALTAAMNEIRNPYRSIQTGETGGGMYARELDAAIKSIHILKDAARDSLGSDGVSGETLRAAAATNSYITAVEKAAGAWKTTSDLAVMPKPDYSVIDQLNSLQQSLAASRKETFVSIELEANRATELVRRSYGEQLMSSAEFERARKLIAEKANADRYNATLDIENKIKDKRIAALNATEGEGFQAIALAHDMELKSFQDMLRAKTISDQQFNTLRDALAQETSGKVKSYLEAEAAKVQQTLQPIKNSIESSFGNAWDNVWQSGRINAQSFFADLSAQLAKAAFQIIALKPLIDSLFGTSGSASGLSGGIVGNILTSFGMPLKAEGGGVRAGAPVMVGDRGRPEVFVPDTAGSIVPAERYQGGGNSGGTTINNVDARGADIGAEQRVYSALARIEAARKSPVADVSNYANRYPTRGIAA